MRFVTWHLFYASGAGRQGRVLVLRIKSRHSPCVGTLFFHTSASAAHLPDAESRQMKFMSLEVKQIWLHFCLALFNLLPHTRIDYSCHRM